ncbi:MAG: hypothetical protein RSE26_00595 [Malacoplasma sp.]
MIYQNSSFFYIKELINYKISANRFIDVKYANCNIEYFESKLIFNYDFYIANNFNLPSDALRLTMEMPSQQITKILLIPSNDSVNINHNLVDNSKTKIFKSKIIVDISDDNYFRNLVEQKNVPINLRFNIDSDSLTNNQINVDQQHFSTLVSEISDLSLNMNFTHTNFVNVIRNTEINHFSNIKIDTDKKEILNSNNLIIDFPEYSNNIGTPIKKLLWIKMNNSKKIELQNINIVLNYSDKNGEKELSIDLMKNIIFSNEIFIDSNYELLYNENKKEYYFNLGDGGIKFLFKTKVSMKIYFDLIIDNKTNRYFFENNFIWKTQLVEKISIENKKEEFTIYRTIYEQK